MTTAGSAKDRILSLKRDLEALLRPPRAKKPPAHGRSTKSGIRRTKRTQPEEGGFWPQISAQDTDS